MQQRGGHDCIERNRRPRRRRIWRKHRSLHVAKVLASLGHVALRHSPYFSLAAWFPTFTSFLSTSISSSAMCSQPNDYFLESFWSPKKAVARLWSPEPRLVNLNSAAVNLPSSSARPTSRAQANCAADARPTIASEVPDNPAAHQVTIGYDQAKHYTEETGDRSRNSPHSPKILFTVANKSYIVTPSVHPLTLSTYPSNLPIERGLASADNDSHVLKHQSVNISTTNTDISTTVPLNAKISLAFSTVDDAETAVNGVISLTFLLMKSISILIDQILQVTRLEVHHMRLSNLCNSLFLSCLVCALLKS